MTGDELIIAQWRKSTQTTIFYVVRQNRLHPRERVIVFRDRESITINTWRRITPTQLLAHTPCCIWQQLLFAFNSLYYIYLFSHFALLLLVPFIGKHDGGCIKWWLHLSMVGATTIDKWQAY